MLMGCLHLGIPTYPPAFLNPRHAGVTDLVLRQTCYFSLIRLELGDVGPRLDTSITRPFRLTTPPRGGSVPEPVRRDRSYPSPHAELS